MTLSPLSLWQNLVCDPIRQIPCSAKSIYLTFDDGPDADSTPAVLELLQRYEAKATFFIVAARAKQNSRLLQDIKAAGHAIGNHSLDHKYSAFFKNSQKMGEWIDEAEAVFKSLNSGPSIGFRPPAGVCTPELGNALRQRRIPLILWQHRYFDKTRRWTEKNALNSIKFIQPGDIILLHDSQRAGLKAGFLKTLDTYLNALKGAGFELAPLVESDFPTQT